VAVEDADDRGTMLADFGEMVTYDNGYAESELNGIFGNEYLEIPAGPGSVDGLRPAFTYRSADLESVAQGHTLERADGVIYKIVGIEPDGVGITLLRLERQP